MIFHLSLRLQAYLFSVSKPQVIHVVIEQNDMAAWDA
jgi:hypothetical protein